MKFFIDLSIFRRNRNFTLLYIGQFVSFFGTMITSVALPYQIYSITHSTLMVGLLSLFQLLPLFVTALVGGVFADRYHRRLLLLVAETILALGSGLLAFNAYHPTPSILLIFIAAVVMAAFNGLHRPALESILQQIVPKEDFPIVSPLSTFKYSAAMIIGPAVGGLLIAHSGLSITYMVDVMTFVVSLLAIFLIRDIPKPVAVNKDESTITALKSGLKYAVSRQELIGTYVVDFAAMIFGMPTALFPAVAENFGGVKALGWLYAAPAVGALFISFVSGWARDIHYHGRAIAISAGLWGIAIVCFGFSTNFYLALFFLALSGALDAVSGIFRSIMWNQTIPNHLRGRMAGIEMISYLSGPRLGDTEAGLVAAAFGVTASIVSGGILCVFGVMVCCYYLPRFWDYKSV